MSRWSPRLCRCRWLSLLSPGAIAWVFLLTASSPYAGNDRWDWENLPVIPLWARQGAPVVGRAAASTTTAPSTDCPPMVQFPMTSFDVAVHFDSGQGLTQIYVGDFDSNRVVRHDVTIALVHTATPLPIPYGVPWIAEDLDGDGQIELVVQRGDLGFEGDGYLDILSTSDWHLRQRFIFPEMKTVMYAVSVNVDADPFREVYLTPSAFFGTSLAVIIKYDSSTDTFREVCEIAAPAYTAGPTAIGDFDQDERLEFLTGSERGYGLFEWRESTLVYVGKVGDTSLGNHLGAVACRPKPGGKLHALLGHSYGGSIGNRYELLAASGDNTFDLIKVFADSEAWIGITPCAAADVDCDGLDEMVMGFHPWDRVWEWDNILRQFTLGCAWTGYGSLLSWYPVDLDQDRRTEWCAVNHYSIFLVFQSPGCVYCDSVGHCVPPPLCYCPCHADPQCDGVRNVQDVVQTVNVAFRGAAPAYDPQCAPERTDVDCSGATDVVDVVAMVDVAFRAAAPLSKFCHPCPD